jgi:hypothetical protein
MSLLTPGYWPANYWGENFWPTNYWANFGLGVPVTSLDFVDCPADQWTKVATAVSTGIIEKVIDSEYLFTYRLTEGTAPTLETDGVRVFRDDDGSDNKLEIISYESIDIYLWSKSKTGRIRADL